MPAPSGPAWVPEFPLPAPRAATRVFFVRHGITNYNTRGRIQGHTDVPLNAAGREQAERVARRLANAGISRIIASDLARTRATAEAVRRVTGVPCRFEPALRERDLGRWAGLSRAEVAAAFPGEAAGGSMSVWSAPPRGEAYAEMALRVARALAALVETHPGERLAVVSHGGPIRVALVCALGMPLGARGRLALDNCSISVIRYGPGPAAEVEQVNDTCHLSAGGP